VLDHTGVHVTDMERSVRFYCDVLGLREAARFTMGAESLAFLQAGSGWIELIADGGAPRGAGIVDHVALQVEDVETTLKRLRAQGVVLLDEAPVEVPEIGARIAFCEGPDGERIELIERR
jgi:catechol 2,3-dioxygenase-like lactoylglutathione lyase family enzyme